MSAFADAKPRAPARILILPPTSFTDTWAERPTANIAVGLRLLSEQDVENATIEAAKYIAKLVVDPDAPSGRSFDQDAQNELYNSRLMTEVVARAVCDPNDAATAHELFPIAEIQVQDLFTSEGIRFAFDALSATTVEKSPVMPQATDAELALLVAHLRHGTLKRLPRSTQSGLRKLLAAVLEPLTAFAPGLDADEPEPAREEDDDEENVYRVRGT